VRNECARKETIGMDAILDGFADQRGVRSCIAGWIATI
jgi:hypothetical protein